MTSPAAGTPPPRIVDGERRVITILFCDVVSSTQLAGQLDPEEWAEVMNEAFQYMIAPIQEYEGMVARLMGDSVLAFFGAPQAHEDDPQRAVLAGLNILSGMAPFIKQFYEDYGLEFNVRVGINTGPVVVGEIGGNAMQEYTAMGDAINLAARMEQTALPGTVQISEDTYRQVAPLFDVWDLGGIDVKGKDTPVQAYRVLGVDPQPGRLRGIEGLETPLIGRAREMHRLLESLQGLTEGRGRIVFLLGEAGLGKSRLVAELRREWRLRLSELHGSVAPTRSDWLEFVAVSYGASRPYDMLKRQLRQYCNIRELDPPAIIHERLNRLVGIYPEELHERLHRYFGFLLGDTLPDGDPLPEGEAFKRELRAVLTDAAAYQTSQGPMVYVMDDLHWADPASIEALRDLLSLAPTQPVLFLLALRPDWNSPGWQLFVNTQLDYAEQCVTIFLEPLSREDGRLLITGLLGDVVPGRIVDAIQQKAEGNPLFIEEVARALYENGVVTRSDAGTVWQPDGGDEAVLSLISLPGNVQALMTARIDRLAPDVRRTLQLAAVIGRTFSQRVLQQLVGPSVAVADHLQALISADLIRPTGSGEGEYTFLHALARDAAYETILLRQRRRHHRHVAEVIEATYPDRLDEEASRLAYHYAEARDWARAIDCYRRAGEMAAKIYAQAEAVEHFSRAIELALAAPAATNDDTLIELYLRRGRIYELDSKYDEALENYEALERLGRERGNPALELAAIPPQAILFVTPTPLQDAARAMERAEHALELAQRLGHAEAEARAYWSLLLLYINIEVDFGRAIEFGERALALAKDNDLREVQAYVYNDIGRAYGLAGRLADANAAFSEARALWQSLGNEPMLAEALALLAQSQYLDGRPAESVETARQALAIAHRIGNRWSEAFCSVALAQGLLQLGRFDEALDVARQAVVKAQEGQFVGPGAIVPIILAWIYRELGAANYNHEQLAAWLANALTYQDYPGLHRYWQKIQHLNEGRADLALALMEQEDPESQVQTGNDFMFTSLIDPVVFLANDRFEETLAVAGRWLERMQSMGFKPFVADQLRYRGLAYRGLGDDEAAREALAQAFEQAQASGNRRILWQILIDRASLAPDAATRASYRAQALAEVNDLASAMDDPYLYDAFLAQPLVRDLLENV